MLLDNVLFLSLATAFFARMTVAAFANGVVKWRWRAAERRRMALVSKIEALGRTNTALNRAKMAAQSANEAKSRYIIGLSHELRTPLNAIFGYAQLMERSETIDEHVRRQVRVVQRSAHHLSGLIDGLLDIAKIEAGRLDIARDEVRLHEFLEQLTGMFKIQSAAKGLTFGVIHAPGLPLAVMTDEKRLRQILINLLSNAIKYTNEGGVTLSLHYNDPIATFEISDTGPGIAESDLERIFAPFERGAVGSAEPGTGLGLTISRLLAAILGGELTVRTTPGRGSTFSAKILLPEVRSPRALPIAPQRIRGYIGRRRVAMIVDDDDVHRAMLSELLRDIGFIVISAQDGQSSLDLIGSCRPDVFLLDLTMPEMDGRTLATRLRQEGHEETPIFVLSAHAADHKLVRDIHCDAFVAKPVDMGKLLDLLHERLQLCWTSENEPSVRAALRISSTGLNSGDIKDLVELGELGFVRGIRTKLDEILSREPRALTTIEQLRSLIDQCDLRGYTAILHALAGDG